MLTIIDLRTCRLFDFFPSIPNIATRALVKVHFKLADDGTLAYYGDHAKPTGIRTANGLTAGM